MALDFGKLLGIHRLYGHGACVNEAHNHGKNLLFIQTVCSNLECSEPINMEAN